MTDTPRTPLDAQMQKARDRLAAKKTAADLLAKRARDAARQARKAAADLEGTARKKRDRARYIVGGVMMARLLRQDAARARGWLDAAVLSPLDRALVEAELASVLDPSGPVAAENVGPLSTTAAPNAPASMAAYPSPGSASTGEHGDG